MRSQAIFARSSAADASRYGCRPKSNWTTFPILAARQSATNASIAGA